MPRAPIIAIADDLTGAAEIAALGFRHGLESAVVIAGTQLPAGVDLAVFDTDSRLDEPHLAAEKLTALGRALAGNPWGLLYKKTDSVLRGEVRAEIEALSGALGLPRVMLLPANPTLGRRVHDGHYTIDGVALHQTAFANDPHHPAKSDCVRDLLGPGLRGLVIKNYTDLLPAGGIVVCNAATSEDVQGWAGRVTANDLSAGGGEFFSALLDPHGLSSSRRLANFSPPSPTLIVSGTMSSAGVMLRDNARRAGVAILPMPATIMSGDEPSLTAVEAWIESVRLHLAEAGVAVVVFDGPRASGPIVSAAIRRAFATCVSELLKREAVQHVIVEGGATAASIARELGWQELHLTHEWSHGVASLRTAKHTSIVLTMKPGSYDWPDLLWQHVLKASWRTPVALGEKFSL